MLTEKDKIQIYGLLTSEFKKNVKIPMASIALYLTGHGLHYEEFGYKKMKALLSDLPEFLTLSESAPGEPHSEFVTITNFRSTHAEESKKKKEESKTVKSPEKKEKPKKKALAQKEVKRLQEVLSSSFEPGKTYPFAQIAQSVLQAGFSPKDYGYGHMKDFLSNLPFLSIKDENRNGYSQCVATLSLKPARKTRKKIESESKAEKPKETKKETGKTDVLPPAEKKLSALPASPAASLPKPKEEKEEEDFKVPFVLSGEENPEDAPVLYVPDKVLLSVKENTGIGLDDKAIAMTLLSDLNNALKEKTLTSTDEAYLFPLATPKRTGEKLVGAFKRANAGSAYDYYLNFVGTDRERPKDVFHSQVRFDDLNGAMKDLAALAKKEPWCYHGSKDPYLILKIYLQYTYYRLAKQGKVLFDEGSGFAAFNTGLVSENYDDIFCVLMKNQDPKYPETYLFQGFTIAASQGLGKVIVEHFSPLPTKASYFTGPEDLFFDPTRDLHTDYQHILLDNIDRFPIAFLKKVSSPFAEEKALVDKISKEKASFVQERLFDHLQDDLRSNSAFFDFLRASFDQAVERAYKITNYDYRFALPSYFPTRDVMSIMLPLTFDSTKGPEAALLCERMPSGSYQGQTILTLKQCYVNARLLGPLSHSFLDADKIED